ncbi:glycosyltransferase LafA [Liquorilactobacillus sucicola DSM 21376 = JCM 15457]|uniref:Glycosyltransferase n=1 Tax=Liquorilactobacillus sucicola DSM 21376 = JCM 15457 TaxID=1423806 RepID=A0A023D0L5_9LACO|nr:glycosyltransferase family 4 protein [Liquorilactobacillus sucicola]KRN05831.1 glycosyltransferase [Liquorilactobacillus sucicola DSM 21376 = JCM 15457]GAJ27310.1 glycosyltransferase LafA [Liquorilactobacillus sucicola DSM 21376 = JCM 15457]
MNIGIFTDTYYPQVSGVATSIKTLKEQLESHGHNVYIFTTTDPKVDQNHYERNIFRFKSIPFISFTDRRIAVRGLFRAYQVAKELNLDIVHTQTEFSMGWIGKFVAKNLKIPCLHTYHTMYEDYLHYVAKGRLLKPYHVKQMSRSFCYHMTGIIAPSERVLTTLKNYKIKAPISIIPTGVNIEKFQQYDSVPKWRAKYGIAEQTPLLLTVSRLAYEKNINNLIAAMPKIIEKVPRARLLIVGDGPAREDLVEQTEKLALQDKIVFTGEVDNDDVPHYYHMANLFVSTSISESQGLTYIEALASGLQVVATHSPYTDQLLDDPAIGTTFLNEDELVASICQYLTSTTKFDDKKKLASKLHDISADNFGERVLQLYKGCQIIYAKENQTSHSSEIS